MRAGMETREAWQCYAGCVEPVYSMAPVPLCAAHNMELNRRDDCVVEQRQLRILLIEIIGMLRLRLARKG
jgi:hypothetical protein